MTIQVIGKPPNAFFETDMATAKIPTKRKHPGFSPKPEHRHESMHFPNGFLWGSATSAHQVEGWNDNSDWWEWEHRAGTIADGQLSGRSADHYHRYATDFDIAQDLGQNIHRLSIEWSRIEPSVGQFDTEQIEHYKQVLINLKERGMQTMVTLHHFTNPKWFTKAGGFEKRKNVDLFLRYVKRVVPELQHLVDYWITINEPNVYVLMGYLLGAWPPGKINKRLAWRVYRHMALAHKRAYHMIHDQVRASEVMVGYANHMISFAPENNHSLIEWGAVRFMDWIWNHLFIERTKGTHDFLGMNYYVHRRLRRSRLTNIRDLVDGVDEGREQSDLDWEIFPPGLHEALLDMHEYKLPIFITENGISTLNDDRRSRYIVSYLKELYHAMQSGVDVRGYLYWSLLDNFEWDKGFKARFGLVEVDFASLERRVRSSAYVYKRICQENAIHHDLLRFIGHEAKPERPF